MIKVYSLNEDAALYNEIAAAAFKFLGLKGGAYLELVFSGSEEIRQVNKRTRDMDSVTDVLSFPALNCIKTFNKKNYPYEYDVELKKVFLGSIMICPDVAVIQAKEFGHSEKRENAYLFLHGLLHLLGFDHENEEDKKKMRATEEQVLEKLNIIREI